MQALQPLADTCSATHLSAAPSSASRKDFVAFIQSGHPCVGALSAHNRNRMHFEEFAPLGTGLDVERLRNTLHVFSRTYPEPGDEPVSLVAMFAGSIGSEEEFETCMWKHLQDVHDADHQDFDWDPTVSADPSSPEFSFSVAGRAFYVIGLHPAASRMARRAPIPCLVFNFHDQFESLRASGKYAGFQRAIQTRDLKLQGSLNPTVSQFGTASEARQYSGRSVGREWECPFHPAGKNVI